MPDKVQSTCGITAKSSLPACNKIVPSESEARICVVIVKNLLEAENIENDAKKNEKKKQSRETEEREQRRKTR